MFLILGDAKKRDGSDKYKMNIKILKSSIFFRCSANGGLKLITIWSKLKETDNQVNWW